MRVALEVFELTIQVTGHVDQTLTAPPIWNTTPG